MGQKIHPVSFRTGITRNWSSRWFLADKRAKNSSILKSYKTFLEEDEVIRKVIHDKVAQAGIASIEIDRTSNTLKVIIRAARPGFIIGRGGKGIEELSGHIEKALAKLRKNPVKGLSVDIEELKRTEVSAAHIAQQIAFDIEKRIPFRQALRKNIEQLSQNKDVKGAKIAFSGRLDGGEIARREWKAVGSLPLQTLRADIDYAHGTAFTTYGTVGIKVWIYRGEVFETQQKNSGNQQGEKNERNNK